MVTASRPRSVLGGIAWLLIAVLLALGGAGAATAMNHTPGTAARMELTWTADQAAKPALDGATAQLQGLSDAVAQLGLAGRDALTSLVNGDTAGLQTALDAGDQRLTAVSASADVLAATLAAVPYTGEHAPLNLSTALSSRFSELVRARSLVAGLGPQWRTFGAQALDAVAVPTLLAQHDANTAKAAKQGAAGHYKQALTLLKAADASMAQAKALRDRLGANADVTTLTAWLDANAAYDTALRTLYTALQNSKGIATTGVKKAFAGEQAARAALPANTRAIVVIMNDIARGGLNQAVIAIDVTRGAIDAIVQAQ